MKEATLPDGERIPVLGLGTWRMGESEAAFPDEVSAIRYALELGYTLIDTAEMYGEGGAEEAVGEAIAGRRNAVFIVSKVYPHNASRTDVVDACERSLTRLQTDCIDLYLLHWPGSIPLAETIAGFEDLKSSGKIRHWGVSNFDTAAMRQVVATAGPGACAANQVLYNLAERAIEWDLLGWCAEQAMPVMAYSPLGQGGAGGLLDHPALKVLAEKHAVEPAVIAAAWTIRAPGVISIPKSAQPEHLEANLAAADLTLDAGDLSELDQAFPPPGGPQALAIL